MNRNTVLHLAEMVVEAAVINDLMRRSDLSRPKLMLWYSGISTFPRAGSFAYLYVAALPRTREWVAHLRTPHPRARLAAA